MRSSRSAATRVSLEDTSTFPPEVVQPSHCLFLQAKILGVKVSVVERGNPDPIEGNCEKIAGSQPAACSRTRNSPTSVTSHRLNVGGGVHPTAIRQPGWPLGFGRWSFHARPWPQPPRGTGGRWHGLPPHSAPLPGQRGDEGTSR